MKMLRSGLKKPAAIAKSTTNHTSFTEPLHRVDSAIPCASRDSICFKENITVNRSEPPKLSMEPQQMKRKKNGGGCNLRKSIAWDRAFLTEEGVLDPIELSIISGSPFREGLPMMAGDTPGSLQSKSIDCQEVKDKPSRKPPDERLGKDQRKYCLSQRLDSSSANIMTSYEVKSSVGSKSRSRCSYSPHPPLPLSSLKRSAIVKTASKGTKMQKGPSSKTDHSPAQTTFKSNIPKVECVNNHQVSLPDFSIQINAGPRSFSKGLKNTQSALEASYSQLMCHLETNIGNSSSKALSSVKSSRAPGEKSDESSVPKIVPDNMTCKPQYSLQGHDETVTSAVCLAQHARNSDKIKYYSQNQSTKSSGLRMPSPSLSFFSQPKASAVHDLSLRDRPTAIYWSQKPGVIRLQDSSSRIVKKDDIIPDRAVSSDGMAISSISGCRPPSFIHGASHRTAELDLGNSSRQMTGMKVSDDTVSSDERGYTLSEDYALQIQDLPERRIERILPENAEMLKKIPEMPSQSGNYEHVTYDSNLKRDCIPVDGEVCRSESRNAGFGSEHYDVHGCETNNETEEWSTCSSLVLTDGDVKGIQSEVVVKLIQQNLLVTQQTQKANVIDSNIPHKDAYILSDGPFRGQQCEEVIGLSEQNLLVTQEEVQKWNFPDKNIPQEDEYIQSAGVGEIKVHQKSHGVSSLDESAQLEDEPNINHQHSGCVVDTLPVLEDHDGNNSSTFVMPLNGRESDIYIQSSKEADTVLVQSPDVSQLECCELLDTVTTSGSLSPSNDGLQFEMPLQEDSSRSICIPNTTMIKGVSSSIDDLRLKLNHCEDHNELVDIDGYFTTQELHVDILRKFSVPEQEQQHERCNLADSSKIKHFPNSTSIEVHEDRSSPVNELQPNLDHVQVKDTLSPMIPTLHQSNECGDGVNEKRTLVIPSNAIPFSDEWLAAMEAAGEDILTKKSGAVQNSPTEKSLPDPSPWSPVKRKNNQIGPYDCTKHQSNSN